MSGVCPKFINKNVFSNNFENKLFFDLNGKEFNFDNEEDFFTELRNLLENIEYGEILIKKEGKITSDLGSKIKFPSVYYMEVNDLVRDMLA